MASVSRDSSRWVKLASSRAVQLFAAATLLSLLLAGVLGEGALPFERPDVATASRFTILAGQVMQIVFALVVIAIAGWITRKRSAIDYGARTGPRSVAGREAIALLSYGAVVLFVGGFLGVGMHLHGTIYGATRHVTPSEVYVWAGYNFFFFAVVPYLIFGRRGYDHRALGLRSENLKNDVLLIAVVLAVESFGELTTFHGLFALSASQLAIGAPLAFVLHLIGTGIPVMIFVYALLFPRYVTWTGSGPAAVVLGACTYAGLHLFEYWTAYDSLTNGVLTLAFVFLQFAFPGLVKSFLTWRTGNAWVHLWAYHAVAPHVTVDTPLIVRIFGIR